MRTIAIATQKGGVGKTTTAWTLANCLRQKGKRVLAIDLDQQRNLSNLFRANTKTENNSLSLFLNTAEAREVIQHTDQGDIIPAGKNLQALDLTLKNKSGKEYFLKNSLEPVSGNYDYCVIDCPPSLGMATMNALTTSDCVVIPVEASAFSLDGLDDIAETIDYVKEKCNNPKLKIAGILLTRYEPNTNLSKAVIDIANGIAKNLNTKVFSSPIRNSVKVREAQMLRTDLFQYAGKCNPAQDYESFTEELLRGM